MVADSYCVTIIFFISNCDCLYDLVGICLNKSTTKQDKICLIYVMVSALLSLNYPAIRCLLDQMKANKLSMGHFLAIFGRLSIRKVSPPGEGLCVTTWN